MTGRQAALVGVILVLAAALGGSIAWAATSSHDSGWMDGPQSMMGDAYSPGSGEQVRTVDGARSLAQRFADRLDLRTGEVMQFERSFYVELVDGKGRGATELLVDPESGSVSLEYGPAMMWNTRYGMMSGRFGGMMSGSEMMGRYGRDYGMMGPGGMMGSGGQAGGMMGNGMMGYGDLASGDSGPSAAASARSVSPSRARAIAQRWLRESGSNLTVGDPDEFPGYYTLHTLRSGRIAGMLSVNATTGTVWPHWWHGRFVTMSE